MKNCLVCNFRSDDIELLAKHVFKFHGNTVFTNDMKENLIGQQFNEFIATHNAQPVNYDIIRDELLVAALGCKDPATVMWNMVPVLDNEDFVNNGTLLYSVVMWRILSYETRINGRRGTKRNWADDNNDDDDWWLCEAADMAEAANDFALPQVMDYSDIIVNDSDEEEDMFTPWSDNRTLAKMQVANPVPITVSVLFYFNFIVTRIK